MSDIEKGYSLRGLKEYGDFWRDRQHVLIKDRIDMGYLFHITLNLEGDWMIFTVK